MNSYPFNDWPMCGKLNQVYKGIQSYGRCDLPYIEFAEYKPIQIIHDIITEGLAKKTPYATRKFYYHIVYIKGIPYNAYIDEYCAWVVVLNFGVFRYIDVNLVQNETP